MIKFKHKQKLLYLHGLGEEVKFPGGGVLYKILRDHFNIDFAELSSDPVQGWKDFRRINFSEHDLVIDFSMGAVYASSQNKTPMVLINPGYGLSRKYQGFKRIDDLSLGVKKDLVKCILVGTEDKYRNNYIPEIQKRNLTDLIIDFPSGHVPEENTTVKYIVPEIRKVCLNLK